MANVLADLTDDEDMVELINIVQRRRARKVDLNRENHFLKWSDGDFIKRFRLSKNGVRFLLDSIQNLISSPTMRNKAVSAQDMVFVTLRFYATGSFLQVVGDYVGIDKSTASRIVYKVSRAIASLHNEFIKMPTTEQEKRTTTQQFYNISRFPKCIGALDCTHIKIMSPGEDEPEIYRNRKGFFSVNIQAICKIV
ncbi:hypothetical protein RI129_000593 [Pyrocoelia pectoralis]|uniref:Nuclease HARBI1 n=1 Tax=Pyrocoelia pectoralis TaxID=417401 RepID=A0AAN7VUA5_9COLE